MDGFEKVPEQWKSPRHAAPVLAIVMGLLWSAAFLCSMYGLSYPLLGIVGYVVALVSLLAFYNTLMNYRRFVVRLSATRTLQLAFGISLYGTLILTVAQYLYFAFLDRGRFLTAMYSAMEMPEMQEYMHQVLSPDVTVDVFMEQMGQVSVGVITFEMFFVNIILTGFAALLAGTLAGLSRLDGTRR